MMPDATPTRRQLIASALGLAGAAAAGLVAGGRVFGGGLSEAAARADAGAVVNEPARRLGVPTTTTTPPTTVAPTVISVPEPGPGQLRFPLQPTAECYVLDNFGDCRGSRYHQGVDIMEARGQPVFAVRTGTLIHRYLDTSTAGYGWALLGDDDRVYRYFHLDGFADGPDGGQLDVGDVVAEAQVIGYVGSTGTSSTDNTHLHLEVLTGTDGNYYGGTAQDPLPLLAIPDGVPIGPPLKGCLP